LLQVFVACITHSQYTINIALDKDGELVWEQLTVEEKEEFQKMLSDGRIGHLLNSYTPWWKVGSNILSRMHNID